MEQWYALTAPFCMHLTLLGFCMTFFRPLKHRRRYRARVAAVAALVLACGLLGLSSDVGFPSGWVETLVYSAGVFTLTLACCETTPAQALYGTTWIITTHQLTMECWLIFCHFVSRRLPPDWYYIPMGLLFYGAVAGVLSFTVARWLVREGGYRVGPRQLTSAILLMLLFEMNYCVLLYGGSFPHDTTQILVLLPAQMYCVSTLYFQNAMFHNSDMQRELDILSQLRYEQQQQYDLAKENIAIINRKCHDLKHQMAAMRSMVSPENQARYLDEIERSVRIYDSILKTGNEVLDTVLTEKSLTCEANEIRLHCVADGRDLGFMDPVDLYTVLGNALDNAIESVQALAEPEKRMIDVLVCTEKAFLVMQVVNPLDEALTFVDGLPVSTKPRDGYHGFGLKSIRHTVEKYGGHVNLRADGGRFSLRVLIPLEDK